jgi:hypothetical protein
MEFTLLISIASKPHTVTETNVPVKLRLERAIVSVPGIPMRAGKPSLRSLLSISTSGKARIRDADSFIIHGVNRSDERDIFSCLIDLPTGFPIGQFPALPIRITQSFGPTSDNS